MARITNEGKGLGFQRTPPTRSACFRRLAQDVQELGGWKPQNPLVISKDQFQKVAVAGHPPPGVEHCRLS